MNRGGGRRSALLFFLVLLGLSVQGFASGPYLNGEFVYNLNLDFKSATFPGMSVEDFESAPGEDYEERIMKFLLEEARWIFSAMIYGADVQYTPSDKARGVDRFYTVELKAEIPFGDSRLEIYDTFLENGYFHVFARYELDTYQERYRDYWSSGLFDSVSAYGYFPYFEENSRINAIKEGIRVALENQLKPEVFNKPGMIEAEVLLSHSPLLSVDKGQNRAFVKIRSNIKSVRHYRVNN